VPFCVDIALNVYLGAADAGVICDYSYDELVLKANRYLRRFDSTHSPHKEILDHAGMGLFAPADDNDLDEIRKWLRSVPAKKSILQNGIHAR